MFILMLFLVLLAGVRWTCADLGEIYSASMRPTIVEGDRVVVNRLAYGVRLPFSDEPIWEWARPRRGDIIVFRSPQDGRDMIKRVIGMPGDRLRMYRNALYVNGDCAMYNPSQLRLKRFRESLSPEAPHIEGESVDGMQHLVMLTPGTEAPNSFGTYVVPADRYFVMGDNRDLSNDSRTFGAISDDLILGRVNRVAISLEPGNGLVPRWKRLLYPLT